MAKFKSKSNKFKTSNLSPVKTKSKSIARFNKFDSSNLSPIKAQVKTITESDESDTFDLSPTKNNYTKIKPHKSNLDKIEISSLKSIGKNRDAKEKENHKIQSPMIVSKINSTENNEIKEDNDLTCDDLTSKSKNTHNLIKNTKKNSAESTRLSHDGEIERLKEYIRKSKEKIGLIDRSINQNKPKSNLIIKSDENKIVKLKYGKLMRSKKQ